MNCNKCNAKVDEELIRHFDTLPPMVGYNYFPPCARCMGCRLPVCQSCMTGLGCFSFMCKEQCKPLWDANTEDKSKPHPRKVALNKMINEGFSAEEIAEKTNTEIKLIKHYIEKLK